MPKKILAFVLGGGGARGAYQVGALRALLEAGYRPDLLVGTSIGAVNAAHLALNGVEISSIEKLVNAWHDAAEADLMPSNYLWLTIRTLFYRTEKDTFHRMRDFFIAHALTPDIRFKDLQGVRLIVVSVDLNTGQVIPYGVDPNQSVLEGVLASTALPPWIRPLHKDEQLLMDGGVVCNLPIEIAMSQGATEIIALDLADPRRIPEDIPSFGTFFYKLVQTIEQRQIELELALAKARRMTVRHIRLCGERLTPVWDFQYTDELIAHGYTVTRQAIQQWQNEPRSAWWLPRLGEKIKAKLTGDTK